MKTKGDRLQSWLSFGANLGVLIGIILVLVELNQNITTMRAQTRSDLSTNIVELFVRVAENEQLASLRRRADAGEELTPDEVYRYDHITRAFFRYWENVHYQYRIGLYDEVEFSRQRKAWQDYAGRSGTMVNWWCQHRLEFSPQFVEEFDALLTTYRCF